ncbi:Phthiotriol/phenolphthiotriol dimycocerosates methyltransferase [Defluviimonas aquaemixtae]|uniref:Phthiotriol/phenolphthiotriol dimycocerosates methyltransferase n=1 Tax=Albidovulum aquaemixtae TaxID=1542388 RepID=A0A2R8B713_9RHOB|nr:class I SAM-dependent methyltransferase [Defluviimonas aquaemixtae]SPH18428.1 Phthiotriol/phenolphthiotriol dimycocerosates methyltransferase [Defluviimonas aquaemixtae]
MQITARSLGERQIFKGARANILYELIGWRFRNVAHLRFMNYGFAYDETRDQPRLGPEDEAERYCVQLYHAVASLVDLKGLSVLDVGSGRGGGASYVHRYMEPAATVGCDLCRNAVAFCERIYGGVAGLGFVRGNAMELPFTANAFDAVLNVESAHCYPDREAFVEEAHRVLRPGGHLLVADFTPPHMEPEAEKSGFETEIIRAGFHLDEVRDVTRNIVHGLDLDDDRRHREIEARFPWGTRRLARLWAGTRDSWIYDDFSSRRREYVIYRATKPLLEPAVPAKKPQDSAPVLQSMEAAHPA